MSFKNILVHVDQYGGMPARAAYAIALAKAHQGHLGGLASTGVTPFLRDAVHTDSGSPAIVPYLQALREHAQRAMQAFSDQARQAGLAPVEGRLDDDGPAETLGVQARYYDLCILGQHDPEGGPAAPQARLAARVAIASGCPVLVVPGAPTFQALGQRVLVAWNGSREAARALRQAMPILQRASAVDVIMFKPRPLEAGEESWTATALARLLAQHGIKPSIMHEAISGEVGTALLSLGAALKSELLVMGCYGHSRVRELLLGGATRTVLKGMTLPLLMAN